MSAPGFKNGKRDAVSGDERVPRNLSGTALCHKQQRNSEQSLSPANLNYVPCSPGLGRTDCRANGSRTEKAGRRSPIYL